MRKVICAICGTEFEASHPRKKYCSEDCVVKNRNAYAKQKYLEIKEDPVRYERHVKRSRERHKPSSICRLCGKVINQEIIPTGHTSKHYHDDCVIKDCLSAIYDGRPLTHAQQLRLYSRGYTIKELKEEFINV